MSLDPPIPGPWDTRTFLSAAAWDAVLRSSLVLFAKGNCRGAIGPARQPLPAAVLAPPVVHAAQSRPIWRSDPSGEATRPTGVTAGADRTKPALARPFVLCPVDQAGPPEMGPNQGR
eukprot:Polyplicarium_translucidae@DN369_c0_g1_i1.p4